MAEASPAFPKTPWPRRFRHTPWRDLLRGRLTGRTDWLAALDASGLPDEACMTIAAVVRHTRLWRTEQAEVARELIAHFADGLAAGQSPDDLLRDFGDRRTAARLIRRAKIRQRPWAWHALRWARWTLLVTIVLYAAAGVPFFTGRPRLAVDYVGDLNRGLSSIPQSDRAWPLYAEALQALHLMPGKAGFDSDAFYNLTVWGEIADRQKALTWLDEHAAGLEAVRRAAGRPRLGFELGVRLPRYGYGNDTPALSRGRFEDATFHYDYEMRALKNVLLLEADQRGRAGDGPAMTADLFAVLHMARQMRESAGGVPDINLSANYFRASAVEAIARALRDYPNLLEDVTLVAFAHELAGPETPGDLIHLDAIRLQLRDTLQRLYTDDGHGDGRPTAEGVRVMRAWNMRSMPVAQSPSPWAARLANLVDAVRGPWLLIAGPSRQDVLATANAELDRVERYFARPLREQPRPPTPNTALSTVGLLALGYDGGGSGVGWADFAASCEAALGRRDGVLVGIALELYRRRHGAYPATLDELVPMLLPSVPTDRIAGGPVKYRLVDGRPLVYSVGHDRVDDNGRPGQVDGRGNHSTVKWPAAATPGDAPADRRGDWVLYSALPPAPPTTGARK